MGTLTTDQALARCALARRTVQDARAATAALDESATAYLRIADECVRHAERALEFEVATRPRTGAI